MLKLPKWLPAAGAVALATATSVVLHRQFQNSLIEQAARTQAAIDYAREMKVNADALETIAVRAVQHAEQAEARADAAEKKLAAKKESYRVVAAAAPDTCAPVIAAANSALASADTALAEQKARGDSLSVAYESEKRAAAALRAGLNKVEPEAEKLVKKSKRSIFAALIPKVGFGVTAGVEIVGDRLGGIGVTAGPSLTWEF